jgi:hypothetical protein
MILQDSTCGVTSPRRRGLTPVLTTGMLVLGLSTNPSVCPAVYFSTVGERIEDNTYSLISLKLPRKSLKRTEPFVALKRSVSINHDNCLPILSASPTWSGSRHDPSCFYNTVSAPGAIAALTLAPAKTYAARYIA